MNKFFKRLALLLAVLMIVSMMPVQLFADNSVTGEGQSNGTGEASGNSNAVAKIGDTGYESLEAALAAANGNGTVTLLTATTELVQALLDGQYGSIDGLTIELPQVTTENLSLAALRSTQVAILNILSVALTAQRQTIRHSQALMKSENIRGSRHGRLIVSTVAH